MNRVGSYSFTVEPFYVDFSGHLFLGVLGNQLLNAAGRHSHDRGWGMDHLNEKQFTWVLSRMCIEMEEMPKQYDNIVVETDTGRIYGYARSIWSMIDTATRKPADLLTFKDGDILRYIVTNEEKPCPIEKHGRFPRLGQEVSKRVIDTYYNDTDINGHINSIKYIEHVLDLYPIQHFREHRLKRFEIAYKLESYPADQLTLFKETSAESDHIEIRKHVGSAEHPEGEVVVQAKVIFSEQS